MAKTESTAVNNLIDLVNSNQRSSKPIVHPDDDLFAAPPSTAKPLPKGSAIPSILAGNAGGLGRPTGGSVPPLPRTRSAGGTSQHALPEHLPKLRMSTAPATRGTTIPPIPQRGSAPVMAKARMSEPHFTPRAPVPVPQAAVPQGTPAPELNAAPPAPVAVAPLSYAMPRQARIDMTGDAVLGENWFEASRAVEKFDEETYVGTAPHVKQEREHASSLVKKLIVPALGFMVVGALIGGFIAFNGDKKNAHAANVVTPTTPPAVAKPTAANAALAANIAHGVNTGVPVPTQPSTESANAATASAAADQPEPPPPTAANALPNAGAVAPIEPANPAIHDVQTTRGVIHLADVRIDSKPAGASVTLVDRSGKKSFLGTTPLATSLDTSHAYDVEVALPGRPEQTAHFDPATTQHVQVELSKKSSAAAKAPAVVAAPKHVAAVAAPKAHHAAASKPVAELADPGFDSKPVTAKPEAPPAPAAGTGTLMVASKPPCEILIDGKSTGLSTPQHAMPLSPGPHKVTLVNAGANINKTVMVQINADQSTKLVKDLL
jgi:hypothetical protein